MAKSAIFFQKLKSNSFFQGSVLDHMEIPQGSELDQILFTSALSPGSIISESND